MRTLKRWVAAIRTAVAELPLYVAAGASALATALVVRFNPEQGTSQFIASVISGISVLAWALAWRAGLAALFRTLAAVAGAVFAFCLFLVVVRLPEIVAQATLVVALGLASAGFPYLMRQKPLGNLLTSKQENTTPITLITHERADTLIVTACAWAVTAWLMVHAVKSRRHRTM